MTGSYGEDLPAKEVVPALGTAAESRDQVERIGALVEALRVSGDW